MALGGGIFIPPAGYFNTGATVTISNSVITGNVAAPAASVDAGFSCGSKDCRFAQAGGGGIDSWGILTLVATTVSNNASAGRFTSDAEGGGIYAQEGALSLDHSIVTRNRTIAVAPNGRTADGAGIRVDPENGTKTARLSVLNSVVSDNSSSLVNNTLPSSVGINFEMYATAGGIDTGDGDPTTVENTAIKANSASATDLDGEAFGENAAMALGCSPLVMGHTQMDDNRSVTAALTEADIGPGGSALQVSDGGTISNSTFDDNLSTATSPTGVADNSGGLAVFNYCGARARLTTLEDSVVSGNITESSSKTGSAKIEGTAVFNSSVLVMRDDKVTDNLEKAKGPTGAAQGGGIWNSAFPGSIGPVRLTLENTSVTHNVLEGSPGVSLRGGGIYTARPGSLRQSNTQIAFNRPDQCFGC